MPIFLSIPRAANGAENRDNAGGLFITVDVILDFGFFGRQKTFNIFFAASKRSISQAGGF